MHVTQSTKVAAIHAAIKHGDSNLSSLIALASSPSIKRELRAAYLQLKSARILTAGEPYERWKVRVWSDADLNVLCPVCNASLKGHVQQALYDCDLTRDPDGFAYETVDSPKDIESELVELRCIKCGLTLPKEAVKYAGELALNDPQQKGNDND